MKIFGSLFGVGSAVLGFVAQATRITPGDIKESGGKCVFPANPACALGFCGAGMLLLAVLLLTGCCCGSGGNISGFRRAVGMISCFLAWILALYTIVLFVIGAMMNKPGTHGIAPACTATNSGEYLENAGMQSLIATGLGLISHAMLRK